ncbi:hypothetical protein Poly30_04280 [Planctomycetes bacterium Poly30]|uniref:MucB/RseB N-terminal domain-containing protein n=1 Tax=Saltatorellus ferox TaxID=2528018 RepID=A0A518ELG8_9BACT|nr:hypothetical protein Poly30_04280 [Planctomycetes bacterium Poly30]
MGPATAEERGVPIASRVLTSVRSGSRMLGVFALVALAACVDNGAEGRAADDGPLPVFRGGAEAGGSLPVLDLMVGVQDRTAFRGIRRVMEMQTSETGSSVRMEQLEDVGADGTGQFSIELFDVLMAPTGVDTLAYEMLFESSTRFLWTMRDFRVRNAAQAASHYAITLLPESPTVAGIPCVRLSFVRNGQNGDRPGHYEADVDPNTGFVLAWQEFDDAGLPLTQIAYESFEYGGDVSNMILRGRSFSAESLNLFAPLDSQAGFEVHWPDVLVGDMQYAKAEVQRVPTSLVAGIPVGQTSYLPAGRWLRLVATDGIEALVFAHSEETTTTSAELAGQLGLYSHGSWTIGLGKIDGAAFVVAGRCSEAQIQQVVGSAF